MAANDYYNQDPFRSNSPRSESRAPQLPALFTDYNTPNTHIDAPYMSSSYEDSHHLPYEQSQHSVSSPYYASGGGGMEHEANPYSDNIPLRQNPAKVSTEIAIQDHLPHDPAIVDRLPESRPKGRKHGFFSGKIPWVVYTLTVIQCAVFIAELAKNGVLTKTPIEIHPQFNPMIGPSPYVLINMGARYVPCMRATSQGLDPVVQWPCPNSTSLLLTDPSNQCSLNELCGFGDQAYTQTSKPRQWYRFIIPMFLHAGFVHIGFNMLLQLLLGSEMEREIGSIRFIIVYLSSGIFGFVLGGNFAPEGITSTGASGSLFGIIAIMLLDLLYHWGDRKSPWVDLAWIVLDVVISFVLGLLPGLDNFSHIGGFLMGLVLGICLLRSPDVLRRRVGEDMPPYAPVRHARNAVDMGGIRGLAREPVGFFKGRKPLWWVWWLVRAAALVGVLAGFIALVENFYKDNPSTCSWCRYLSCIDIKNWCDIGNLQTTNTTSNGTSPAKRDFAGGALPGLSVNLF